MNTEETRYQKAKGRVKAIKGLYVHLTVYVIVNVVLFSVNMVVSPDGLWFFWPLTGWGIGLAFHALTVFGFSRAFGADWEEKKIREFMEKE